MDPNQYFLSLKQQGFSDANALHYTQQYYPDFIGPSQVISMPPPAPPGSIELGTMTSSGFGAPTGGMVIGTATAGGVAAAGGGMSVTTIVVVSVLVLGGGTAGYFIYDYLTEPDFFGETYWDDEGYGIKFEEDRITYVFTSDDFDSEICEMMVEYMDSSESIYKNDKCYISFIGSDVYNIDEKGDYYTACILFYDYEEEDCINVYPLDGGAVIKNSDGGCTVLVSDIRDPDYYYDGDVTDNWSDDFEDKAESLMDDGPRSCDYD